MELFLTIIYLLICIGLIVSVLLQSGKSAGIAGSIAGGAETLFGKKKGIDDKLARYHADSCDCISGYVNCNDCFLTLGFDNLEGNFKWKTW